MHVVLDVRPYPPGDNACQAVGYGTALGQPAEFREIRKPFFNQARGGSNVQGFIAFRTASGVHAQEVEIEYKKPTATRVNCGDRVSRMIPCDSFGRNLGTRGKGSFHCGGNATKLN